MKGLLKKGIGFLGILFVALPGLGRAQFVMRGEVVFEKKQDVQRMFNWEEDMKQMRQFAKNLPKNMFDHFTLNFEEGKTEYRYLAEKETEGMNNWFLKAYKDQKMANKNTVLTDFTHQKQTSLKGLFENDYQIEGPLPAFQWKIEDEIREIAGFPCRKAVTTIFDSVVVVAFYTDRILVQGGPESFNGLPGMILGVAIPRLYTSWFATEVKRKTPEFAPLDAPKKTKVMSPEEFEENTRKSMKGWGRMGSLGDSFLWQVLL